MALIANAHEVFNTGRIHCEFMIGLAVSVLHMAGNARIFRYIHMDAGCSRYFTTIGVTVLAKENISLWAVVSIESITPTVLRCNGRDLFLNIASTAMSVHAELTFSAFGNFVSIVQAVNTDVSQLIRILRAMRVMT